MKRLWLAQPEPYVAGPENLTEQTENDLDAAFPPRLPVSSLVKWDGLKDSRQDIMFSSCCDSTGYYTTQQFESAYFPVEEEEDWSPETITLWIPSHRCLGWEASSGCWNSSHRTWIEPEKSSALREKQLNTCDVSRPIDTHTLQVNITELCFIVVTLEYTHSLRRQKPWGTCEHRPTMI